MARYQTVLWVRVWRGVPSDLVRQHVPPLNPFPSDCSRMRHGPSPNTHDGLLCDSTSGDSYIDEFNIDCLLVYSEHQ